MLSLIDKAAAEPSEGCGVNMLNTGAVEKTVIGRLIGQQSTLPYVTLSNTCVLHMQIHACTLQCLSLSLPPVELP